MKSSLNCLASVCVFHHLNCFIVVFRRLCSFFFLLSPLLMSPFTWFLNLVPIFIFSIFYVMVLFIFRDIILFDWKFDLYDFDCSMYILLYIVFSMHLILILIDLNAFDIFDFNNIYRIRMNMFGILLYYKTYYYGYFKHYNIEDIKSHKVQNPDIEMNSIWCIEGSRKE